MIPISECHTCFTLWLVFWIFIRTEKIVKNALESKLSLLTKKITKFSEWQDCHTFKKQEWILCGIQTVQWNAV